MNSSTTAFDPFMGDNTSFPSVNSAINQKPRNQNAVQNNFTAPTMITPYNTVQANDNPFGGGMPGPNLSGMSSDSFQAPSTSNLQPNSIGMNIATNNINGPNPNISMQNYNNGVNMASQMPYTGNTLNYQNTQINSGLPFQSFTTNPNNGADRGNESKNHAFGDIDPFGQFNSKGPAF